MSAIKPMSFDDRAAFRKEISVLEPEIARFCADVGYSRDQSYGTFPGFRLVGPREPRPVIEIEFAADKFVGETYAFTPDLLFSISSGTQWREEPCIYRYDGPLCMTYVEFAVVQRHIAAILRKAHASLSRLTIADVISEGFRIEPDAYNRPPFPSLPLDGPLVSRVISEAELERFLGA
jgi:hypothetical protein